MDTRQKMIIRKVREGDDFDEITTLIRSAYKVLLDKGFYYWGTRQTVEDTKHRLNDGEGYLAFLGDELVGTITFRTKYVGESETPWYDNDDVGFFSQFAIKPNFQKSGLGGQLMDFVESLAKEKGFKEIALDTSEGATELIEYYQKRGYRFIEYVQWDRTTINYRSVILSKNLFEKL